ncbi:MAG: hypothetical protein M1142_04670 [Patescibacteria group bacterium]|nr:hypothetical protein [Patescibacteria group bacterium]
MNTENPNRDVQREMVYQQIQDPISRELLRSSIPGDKVHEYRLASPVGPQFAQNLVELLRRERGNAIRGILGVAATAQNPAQLSNALGTFGLLAHQGLLRDEANQLFDQAQDEFLRQPSATPFATDGARALQAQMIGMWNEVHNRQGRWDTPESKEGDVINLIHHLQDEICKGLKNNSGRGKYWAEAYLLTVLDPGTPFGLRKILLSKTIKLDFGIQHYVVYSYSYGNPYGDDPRFNQGASIWGSASAAWVYPEIFGSNKGGDVKDWEIAGLRKTIASLQQQLERTPRSDAGIEQERARLRELMLSMQRMVTEGEAKLRIYKEIGQHPLDALGLGYDVWRRTDIESRKKLVLGNYRERAKRYHYQIPSSDPRFDPLLQELANKEFGRLTKAYDYLNQNITKEEF